MQQNLEWKYDSGGILIGVDAKASVRCNLLHIGDPKGKEQFSFSTPQLTKGWDVLRDVLTEWDDTQAPYTILKPAFLFLPTIS